MVSPPSAGFLEPEGSGLPALGGARLRWLPGHEHRPCGLLLIPGGCLVGGSMIFYGIAGVGYDDKYELKNFGLNLPAWTLEKFFQTCFYTNWNFLHL